MANIMHMGNSSDLGVVVQDGGANGNLELKVYHLCHQILTAPVCSHLPMVYPSQTLHHSPRMKIDIISCVP